MINTNNTNISPWEKECLHKWLQRNNWSPEMRLKVQEYDCNRKRLQAEQANSNSSKTTPSEKERKQKIKCKLNLQQNEKGFKTSVKKLFTLGLNSPKKKEFLFDYFEKHGIKVECEGGVKSELKSDNSDKSVSILQLKAFKLQNRVKDHQKLVCKIKDIYGSLNKVAKALKIHY